MSKIQSMKQEKRYRNETINVLNHTNSKSNAPSLADRSLHAFKVVKQEVQSSRINRPQTSKLSTRYEVSYYPGYSKEKDKTLECDRIQKISSKSLQSRFNSRNNKAKKQNENKTKKNSYSRLCTDVSALQIAKDSERAAQQDMEKRLQAIERIFLANRLDHQDKPQGGSIQSPSIYEFRKNLNPLDMSVDMVQMGYKSKKRMPDSKGSSQMILDLKEKFQYFNDLIEERKCKMIYDSLDCSFTRILQKLQGSFMAIIDCMLRESDDKMKNFQCGLEQFISEQKYEMQKQSRKFERLKQSYIDKIEGLLVRSLYVTDKINTIQERGLFNFERAVRVIDGSEEQESKSETLSVSVGVKDSKVGWHRQMDESESQAYEEDAFQFSQNFRQPKDEFAYVLSGSDDKAKFNNKFYSQSSAKCLR